MPYSNNFRCISGVEVKLVTGLTISKNTQTGKWEYSGTPSVLKTYDQIRGLTPIGGDPVKLDVTHLNSPGPFKEYIPGTFLEGDSVSFDAPYDAVMPPDTFTHVMVTFGSLGKTIAFAAIAPAGYKPNPIEVNKEATVKISLYSSGPVAESAAV